MKIKEIVKYLEDNGIEPIVMTGSTDKELRMIYNSIKEGQDAKEKV